MTTSYPILFSSAMVLAILDERKTQTRRIVKFKNHDSHIKDPMDGKPSDPPWPYQLGGDGRYHKQPCPYGQPGHSIWCKETFHASAARVRYRADDMIRLEDGTFSPAICNPPKWTPSIFMPRTSSRLTLPITAVRAERLQDISPADCDAEGIAESSLHTRDGAGRLARIQDYRSLWNSINLKPKPIFHSTKGVSYVSYPWSLDDLQQAYPKANLANHHGPIPATYNGFPLTITPNPWVWVITFSPSSQ